MVEKNTFAGGRILVAEDDYFIVAEMVQELIATGAEVVGPIPNVDQALDRLRNVPGIVGAILDINLQGHPVYPLADELRKRNIPFVFATGYDETAIPGEYLAVPRFTKPVDVAEVSRALLAEAN
jgi:DNA-binding LytR/AlgR family response regulator